MVPVSPSWLNSLFKAGGASSRCSGLAVRAAGCSGGWKCGCTGGSAPIGRWRCACWCQHQCRCRPGVLIAALLFFLKHSSSGHTIAMRAQQLFRSQSGWAQLRPTPPVLPCQPFSGMHSLHIIAAGASAGPSFQVAASRRQQAVPAAQHPARASRSDAAVAEGSPARPTNELVTHQQHCGGAELHMRHLLQWSSQRHGAAAARNSSHFICGAGVLHVMHCISGELSCAGFSQMPCRRTLAPHWGCPLPAQRCSSAAPHRLVAVGQCCPRHFRSKAVCNCSQPACRWHSTHLLIIPVLAFPSQRALVPASNENRGVGRLLHRAKTHMNLHALCWTSAAAGSRQQAAGRPSHASSGGHGTSWYVQQVHLSPASAGRVRARRAPAFSSKSSSRAKASSSAAQRSVACGGSGRCARASHHTTPHLQAIACTAAGATRHTWQPLLCPLCRALRPRLLVAVRVTAVCPRRRVAAARPCSKQQHNIRPRWSITT